MGNLVLNGSTSGAITLSPTAIAGSNTLTLPAATDTLVGKATTDTLTNKTLTSPVINTPTMGGSVITSGTAVASTSGTSITFTGIPSWVKRITVMLRGVAASGTSGFQIQLGTSGGFVTSGYSSTAGTTTNVLTSTTAIVLWSAGATQTSINGAAVISLVSSASYDYVATGNVTPTTATYGAQCLNAGVTTTNVVTQLKLMTINGSDAFSAGTVNILYE